MVPLDLLTQRAINAASNRPYAIFVRVIIRPDKDVAVIQMH